MIPCPIPLLPTLQSVVDDTGKRFVGQLERVRAPQSNEVCLQTRMETVAPMSAYLYRKWGARLIGLFAEDARGRAGVYLVHYLFALDKLHGFLTLQVPVNPEQPELISLTNAIPAVNWQEREIQDLFGLKLVGHPNPRRCALHDDWPSVHPLRRDFDLRAPLPPRSGPRHQFRPVEGDGVFQVPVGPVHAGVIEPGHFLFSVAGEPVLYLQIRLAYTHKATEKLFESLPVPHAVCLAESISGDSSFAHATAFCHALERITGAQVPPRARVLRTICLELERIYNHIADIGAIATDVGFAVANSHALRLKERLLRLNEELTGNRLLRGMVCPGGVRRDWDPRQTAALAESLLGLSRDFETCCRLIRNSASTRDRLEGTGILRPQTAADLGIVGLAGRASGLDRDLRRDFPHAAYDQVSFTVPVYTAGDVLHRMQVRVDEVAQSLSIITQLLHDLGPGAVWVDIGKLPPDQFALGYVEGWRGEIFHWIRTAPGNRLARCKVKDPSLQNWPALSEAVQGNILPDFPVINKSFNLSYSGTDR
jgi:Ni,Fe-hydrogenase III large subunit/Ni,Fe-hydrogenase III component G